MYPLSGIERPAFFEYGDIASNLVAGNGYSIVHWIADTTLTVPSAWMPPGQVLVTTGFFAVFGEGAGANHLIFLLNALLGTAAVYVLGRCTGMITESGSYETVALYAAALFPPFISAASTWGIASSVLLLNSLVIYRALLFSRAILARHRLLRESIYFGLIAGVLALFRAEAPLTIAFILLGMLIFHREQMPRDLKYLVASGLMMLAVLSPWLIYNYVRFDTLILGSTSGGYNLWRGNNPIASGGGWTSSDSVVLPTRELQQDIWQNIGHVEPLDFERAYNSELAKEAVSWIREDPSRALLLSLKKGLIIWTVDLYHPSKLKYIYGLFQIGAILLASYGLLSLRNRGLAVEIRRWLWIAGGACVAATLLTMVFFSLPRYQIFLVGLYFPLVAIGMHSLLQKWGLVKDSLAPSIQSKN